MAASAASHGAWGVSFEIADSPSEDVLSRHSKAWLCDVASAGLLCAIWIGLVCASWSRARRNTSGKRGWPGPLRDNGPFLWGLPGLSPKDQERVSNGNRQLRWAAQLFKWAAHRNIACVIGIPNRLASGSLRRCENFCSAIFLWSFTIVPLARAGRSPLDLSSATARCKTLSVTPATRRQACVPIRTCRTNSFPEKLFPVSYGLR